MELSEVLFISGVFVPLSVAAIVYILGTFLGRSLVKILAIFASFVAFVSAIASSVSCFAGSLISAHNSVLGSFGLNGISAVMYLLAGTVSFCATLWCVLNRSSAQTGRTYYALLLFMQGGLMGMFSSMNIFLMYAFHEFALVPTFIAICVWGMGENKRKVAMEMAIYLTLGALISLIGLIALGFIVNGELQVNLNELSESMDGKSIVNPNKLLALLTIGFGALVSLFPLHSWAAKTYNAAPCEFAMLHAGVLKKFGLYMLAQVVLPIFASPSSLAVSDVVAVLALVNIIGIGLCTMAQSDFKMMVSYSSVSHMGLCFLGLFTFSTLGMAGSVILMFAHGISVAALFILAEILNNRFGTLEMSKLGGAYKKMPICAMFFIMAILANIGLPAFANFWGEFSIFVSLWNFSHIVCALAVSGIVISAIYGLRAVANIFYGKESEIVEKSNACDLKFREKLPLVILILMLLVFGFAPKLMTNSLNASYVSQASTLIEK